MLLLTRYKKHYLRVGHFYKSKVTFFSYKPSKALFILSYDSLAPESFRDYEFFVSRNLSGDIQFKAKKDKKKDCPKPNQDAIPTED